MNILYLIGNGFDLNLNLKTSYKDFYNFILEKNNEKDLAIVAKFKNEIKNKPTNWSDLELELGKFTAEIDSIEDANNLHDYLIDKLSSYLKLIEDNWDIEDGLPIDNLNGSDGSNVYRRVWTLGNNYILKCCKLEKLMKNLKISKALHHQGFASSLPVLTKTGSEYV